MITKALRHYGWRSACRLVTQASSGFSWLTAVACIPMMLTSDALSAFFMVLAVAFVNLHFLIPLNRPRVRQEVMTISSIHRYIRLGFREGLSYALIMAVLRYLIVVSTLAYYGAFEALHLFHMFMIGRLFDVFNWGNLADKWRALHIK